MSSRTETSVPDVEAFYEDHTGTLSYVVSCAETRRAAVIDPVLDYEARSGTVSTDSVDHIADYVESRDLEVDWILDTHAHADHLSGVSAVKERVGGKIAIGEGIRKIQANWSKIYNLPDLPTDGRQFDHLFADGETFEVGTVTGRVMPTPGHTDDSVTYVIGDAAFIGDTLFMPDYGTARCDFPGGDAARLYASIQAIYALPPETRLFVCHDYRPGGRALAFQTSVAEQRADNIHLNDGIDEAAFVKMRRERDATLSTPGLLLQALQVNIRAGHLPAAEDNGRRYFKIPIDLFKT